MVETNSPLVEYARTHLYSDGGLVRVEDQDGFFSLPTEDKARYLAARLGCGVVEELLVSPKYGADYLVGRYGQIAFWYGYLKSTIPNTDFLDYPEDLGQDGSIFGPALYEGLVLPQLMIDIIDRAIDLEVDPVDWLNSASYLIQASNSLDQAIALLARLLDSLGVPAKQIKNRIFSSSIREELPEGYWLPIFRVLNSLLPKHLHYQG